MVYILRETSVWVCSGGVSCIGLVGEEGVSLVTIEGVGLVPHELVAIGGQQRHKAWVESGVGHGEYWFCARQYQIYLLPLTGSALCI